MPRFTVDLDAHGVLKLSASNPEGDDVHKLMNGYALKEIQGVEPSFDDDQNMVTVQLTTPEHYNSLMKFLQEHYDMDVTINGANIYKFNGTPNPGAKADVVGAIRNRADSLGKSTTAPSTYQAPTATPTMSATFSGGLFTVTMAKASEALKAYFPGRTVVGSYDGKSASVQCKDKNDATQASSFVQQYKKQLSNVNKLLDDIGTWASSLKDKAGSFFRSKK